MSITVAYNVLSNSGSRAWFALGFVGSSLYGADPSSGIYQLDVSTGTETFKRSEQINFRGLSSYLGSLASVAYGSYVRAFSTSSFTTVSNNWGNAYGGAWFDICDAGTYAYAIKYSGGSTNQIAKLANDGSVTYGTTSNRAYTGITYLNGYLYAAVDGGQIYKIDPSNNYTETLLSNSLTLAWRGLTTDGTYLYSAVYGGYIYQINPVDGTCVQLSGDSSTRNWQNVAYGNGALYGCVYQGQVWKITLPTPPSTPTSSISTSTIYVDTTVTLSCSTSGAIIKYTTDGTTPGLNNGTIYSGSITISKTTTIKFCAIKDGYLTTGVDSVITMCKGIIGGYVKKVVIGSNSNNKMQICHSGDNMYLMYNAAVYKFNGSTFDYLYTPGEAPSSIAASDTYIWTSGNYFVYRRTVVGGSTVYFNYAAGWGALCYSTSIFGVGYGNSYYYSGGTGTGTPSSLSGLGSGWNYGYQMCKVGSDYYVSQALGTNGINKIHGTTITAQLNPYTNPITNRITGICTDGTYLYFAVDNGYVYMQDLSAGVVMRVYGDIARSWRSLSYNTVSGKLYGLYRDTNGDDCLAEISLSRASSTTEYVYTNGSWKQISSIYTYNNSNWKSTNNLYKANQCDIWTRIPM